MCPELSRADQFGRFAKNYLPFAIKRVSAFRHEVPWAVEGKPMPAGADMPPPWVARVIQRMTQTGLAPLFALDPRKRQTANYGDVLEMLGMESTGLSFFAHPPSSITKEEEGHPELAKLREAIGAAVVKLAEPELKAQAKALKKIRRAAKPANIEQIQENAARLHKGTVGLFGTEGTLVKGDTVSGDIYGALWLFWPQLGILSNAREVHAWLASIGHRGLSLKLVEKICSEVGMFKGKRGRPRAKKFLQAARGE
jgi:hypothetical protein